MVPHEGVGLQPTLSSSMATSAVLLTHVKQSATVWENKFLLWEGLEVSVSDWDPWCTGDL